jgi:FAD/FMN-containing dehydrogenase
MIKERIAEIIGSPNVTDDPVALAQYTNDMSFVPQIKPRCAARVESADAVAPLVKWAYETGTPLVPVSSGPPHFNGDTLPGVGGAVIVDLSGMKKIIRVDRRNRVVMIEPGVTFGELIPAVEKEGLSLLMPLLPRSEKSVLTSFLERTPITNPRFHWEPQDPTSCVEVIYGTGELMRTGSASIPDTLEKQWALGKAQMRGMGPSQVDFTRLLQGAQGTLGIVTWATIKCRPLAKCKKMFLIESADVNRLIELVYQLTYRKLGEEIFILNRADLAAMLGKDKATMNSISAQLPPWVLVLGIEGAGVLPEERVEYQEAESIEIAQSLGLGLKRVVPGARVEELAGLLTDSSTEPYWKTRRKGANADIFFLSTLDKASDFVETMTETATKHQYDVAEMGVYIQPTVQGANCHIEFSFGYDPESSDSITTMKRLIEDGSEKMAGKGAFFSRPYGSWSRIAYRGDAQVVVGQRKLKEIFDPAGILNPGKLCY